MKFFGSHDFVKSRVTVVERYCRLCVSYLPRAISILSGCPAISSLFFCFLFWGKLKKQKIDFSVFLWCLRNNAAFYRAQRSGCQARAADWSDGELRVGVNNWRKEESFRRFYGDFGMIEIIQLADTRIEELIGKVPESMTHLPKFWKLPIFLLKYCKNWYFQFVRK